MRQPRGDCRPGCGPGRACQRESPRDYLEGSLELPQRLGRPPGFKQQLTEQLAHRRQAILHRHVLLRSVLSIGGGAHPDDGAGCVLFREGNPRRCRRLLDAHLLGPVWIARRNQLLTEPRQGGVSSCRRAIAQPRRSSARPK
jgi:hypothetical protein